MLETAGSTGRFEHLSGAKTNSIVDFREALCKTKPPEKANSEGYFNRTIIPKKSRAKNNTNLESPSWFVLFRSGAVEGGFAIR